jgi:hypothetical protein
VSNSLWVFLRRVLRRRACDTPQLGDYANKRQPLAWPSAVLLCVRNPVEHPALLEPFADYRVGYPNIFGPPRTEPHCECGSLMYVAAARVTL